MSNQSTHFDNKLCDIANVVTDRRRYKRNFKPPSKSSQQWVFGTYNHSHPNYSCDKDFDDFEIHDIIKPKQ